MTVIKKKDSLKNKQEEITIRVSVPTNHHVYIDKGKDGYFIPLRFDFSLIEADGYVITPHSTPEGTYDTEVKAMVLRGDGDYLFLIQKKKKTEKGGDHSFFLHFQICDDSKGICYQPQTMKGILGSVVIVE